MFLGIRSLVCKVCRQRKLIEENIKEKELQKKTINFDKINLERYNLRSLKEMEKLGRINSKKNSFFFAESNFDVKFFFFFSFLFFHRSIPGKHKGSNQNVNVLTFWRRQSTVCRNYAESLGWIFRNFCLSVHLFVHLSVYPSI